MLILATFKILGGLANRIHVFILCNNYQTVLRIPVQKNETLLGRGREFIFAHIFMVDYVTCTIRLGHD